MGPTSIASAINIKTGTSVFSLNLSPRQNRKGTASVSKTGRKRLSSNKLITPKSLPTPPSTDRKKPSRQRAEDEWTALLSERGITTPLSGAGKLKILNQ